MRIYSKCIHNILKIWVKPFSLIFFATIILGFLSYHIKGRYSSRKNVFRWHFWGTIAALLGEPGTVVEVSQKGYLLHDRLVRPAMVGISKKLEKNDTKKEKQEENWF